MHVFVAVFLDPQAMYFEINSRIHAPNFRSRRPNPESVFSIHAVILGLYWDNGKEAGNYWVILGFAFLGDGVSGE